MQSPFLSHFAGLFAVLTSGLPGAEPANAAGTVTLESLLAEMCDPVAVARLPDPPYQSLQASSYNRASEARDQADQGATGWFADSDGTGFIRVEKNARGADEWVLMEHAGPGCITKMWTPFFYFNFQERGGPNIRVYLDGATEPVLDEPFIALTRGEGSFKPPFGAATARAGNTYLPIAFARGAKITLTAKPFYNIINYRAYPEGTSVRTFRREDLVEHAERIAEAGRMLYEAAGDTSVDLCSPNQAGVIYQDALPGRLPRGPAAISWFSFRLNDEFKANPGLLRSTILKIECDGETTVWCPIGDFFSCPDAIHPYHTWQRTVKEDGVFTCRWPMPYREEAKISLGRLNGEKELPIEILAGTISWKWDDRSMHFHATWRPDELLPGTPFQDWNFVDVAGSGVYVGDTWTVLNPTHGWWGEGDEKIYVDGAWDAKFPTHFGTGTEDYYGWAGGVNPTREDEFDEPFLANVRVGGVDGNHTRGFNILTRTRALDAIPFSKRLRFDMEISPGTGQRRPSDFLGYSAVSFWYARPGARHNRPFSEKQLTLMSLADIERSSAAVKKGAASVMLKGVVECEGMTPVAKSAGLTAQHQRPHESMHPEQWSGGAHLFIPALQAGDFVELAFTEQFEPAELELFVTRSFDFGVADISVNGRKVAEGVDLYEEKPGVMPLKLGRCEPVENRFLVRIELKEPNPKSRGARTYLGVDALRIVPVKP